MPARRINRNRITKKPKKLGLKKIFYFAFVAIIMIFASAFFVLASGSRWDGKERLSIVMPSDDGSVSLYIIDPRLNEITKIIIPKDTEVNVARQMGEWRIGSVWQLGVQEKIGGQLLADTTTKSLRMPVDAWISKEGKYLLEGGLFKSFKVALTSLPSNLSRNDRLRIALFSFKTSGKGRVEIKLEQTGYLEEVRLTDGDYGFRIKKSMPTKLIKLFYVPEIASERALVKVTDASDGDNARNIAEIVKVLGAKVVSLESEEPSDVDCVVRGAKEITVKYIAKTFSCKEVYDELSEEVIIEFGKAFDKRY